MTKPNSDPSPAKSRMFRAHFSIDLSYNASTGDRRHYESLEELRCDLVQARADEMIASATNAQIPRPMRMLAKQWRSFWRQDTESHPRVKKINGVEQFVDGQWIPLTVTFIDPDVIVEGVVG